MASISMEQKELQAEAREALLTQITKATNATNDASRLLTLSRAYALVVAPQGGGGKTED